MSSILSESEIGQAFVKALGLSPENLRKVTVTLEVDNAITIETEGNLSTMNLEGLTTEVKRYKLCLKEEKPIYRCVKCGHGFMEEVTICPFCGSFENIIKEEDIVV